MVSSLWAYGAERLIPINDDPGYALGSGAIPWRLWCERYFPSLKHFGQRHVNLWEWFDSLERGVKPRPRIEIWSRGGAKSSSIELGITRLAARLTRRFVLYVCETQSQADYHVQSIEPLLRSVGASPLLNQEGRTKSWRRNQLRTANGFNLAAYGLDTAARGIKIEQFRPDLIVLDDIDGRHDSIEAVQRKIECITQSVLPTGSPDCAVVLAQNLIHANSIASQLSDDRAKFLLDRDVPGIEVAVLDLVTEAVPQGPGLPAKYRIVSGTPTWEGQNLATCEAQINEWGLDTFLREAQHEVKRGGEKAFPSYQGRDFLSKGRHGRHIEMARDIPAHWTYFGGLDWGYNAPFAFVLMALSPTGKVYGVDEVVQRRLSNKDQADAVKRKIAERVGSLEDCIIYYDPAMDAKKVANDSIGRADIEDFRAAGLRCVCGNNNRFHGWNNLRNYLEAEDTFVIMDGRMPSLCDDLENAVHKSKTQFEDVDDDAATPPGHLDALSATRYALMSRILVPQERVADNRSIAEKYADTNREIHEAHRIERMKRNGMQPVRNKDGAIEYNDDGDIVWEEAPRKSKGAVKGFGGR